MGKIVFLIFMLSSFLISSEIKELKTFDDIKEDKKNFLMFSTDYCPWCAKQKRVLEEIDIIRDDLYMFYVNDSSDIFKKLLKKYSFSIKYFPTSYVIEKSDGELIILYEFQGYQKKENILKVLNDEDSF
ncbi:thioredoxin fold domain-containing protein [Arcobacter arenosus]|jgi:thioredoxin-related protein|uniref:Thioredoxin-like fold domain-containing protein n=1 Tax=Arcobacter arenosus TaxID=2576037 RepID=A0A5R8Y074_9BACT|nr:thioredoxin fold domain-containing protein [Arcobacter arenosus]TLP38271.1 hypothetical protein FDK22_07295 [Arcobacter arenosus]